jgi:hypothetical protein
VGAWREDTLEWGVGCAVVDFVHLLLVGFAICHGCTRGAISLGFSGSRSNGPRIVVCVREAGYVGHVGEGPVFAVYVGSVVRGLRAMGGCMRYVGMWWK